MVNTFYKTHPTLSFLYETLHPRNTESKFPSDHRFEDKPKMTLGGVSLFLTKLHNSTED